MTVVSSGAQTVVSAVFFPHGEDTDISSIGDDIFASIIAAPYQK
jgi:hypothetical protein